jgi:hypothetical protein
LFIKINWGFEVKVKISEIDIKIREWRGSLLIEVKDPRSQCLGCKVAGTFPAMEWNENP